MEHLHDDAVMALHLDMPHGLAELIKLLQAPGTAQVTGLVERLSIH